MLSDHCIHSKEKCTYFGRSSLVNSLPLTTYFPTLGRKIVSPCQELTVGLIYKLAEKKDVQCKIILGLYSVVLIG